MLDEHARLGSGHPIGSTRTLDDKVDELLSLMRGMASKDSDVDLKLAESNAILEEILSRWSYRPDKRHDQPDTKSLSFDVLADGAFDRGTNRGDSRRQRLDEFVARHGSLKVVLPDKRKAIVQDISESGDDSKLIVRIEGSETRIKVPLSAVTVIPF
jgi:hypothetical protein